MKLTLKNHFISLGLFVGLAMGSHLWATKPVATVGQPNPDEKTSTAVVGTIVAEQPKTTVVEVEPAKTEEAELGAPLPPPTPKAKKSKRPIQPGLHFTNKQHSNNGLVGVGHSVSLEAGKKADAVVSVLGSSSSSGEVRDAVVSILGNTRVNGGTVGQSAVAVLGNVYVNGHVRDSVVAVLGNVELGPDAVVDGEIVCIGGQVTRDDKAQTKGVVSNIAIGGQHFNFGAAADWFTECLLKGRLLALDARVGWAWLVAFVFLGFYVFIALLVPDSVSRCVQTLEERPGKSVLAAVLALVLTPMAYLLLVITILIGIGLLLIPVFSLGLFIAGLFGKIVVLAWLGRRLTGAAMAGPLRHPAVAVLVGGVVAMGLYAIPYVGIAIYQILGIIGLGVVIYTLIQVSQRRQATVPPLASAFSPTLPPVISAATLPRAGFWLRTAAALLDVATIGVLLIWVVGGFPLWLAIYSVVMWATKGTTIGGIICGLKVVRIDDRPVDWGVAVVRGLGAFLSLAVAGLGFIWVAFDDEKQSWHDKIAGTTIVRVPRGTALI